MDDSANVFKANKVDCMLREGNDRPDPPVSAHRIILRGGMYFIQDRRMSWADEWDDRAPNGMFDNLPDATEALRRIESLNPNQPFEVVG